MAAELILKYITQLPFSSIFEMHGLLVKNALIVDFFNRCIGIGPLSQMRIVKLIANCIVVKNMAH